MVDTRIRKNERCIIGLPSCDYVFSSTRSCFIAYGFSTSALERDVLKALLQERGIEAVEAGSQIEPGKFAFCTKICSKIIVAQFCIVLANNDQTGPNANVCIEYGLMLGHNKYVIPFQRADETLPFNVAGLDTIKYDQADFRQLAIQAIDQAIRETSQSHPAPRPSQFHLTFEPTSGSVIDTSEQGIHRRYIRVLAVCDSSEPIAAYAQLRGVYFRRTPNEPWTRTVIDESLDIIWSNQTTSFWTIRPGTRQFIDVCYISGGFTGDTLVPCAANLSNRYKGALSERGYYRFDVAVSVNGASVMLPVEVVHSGSAKDVTARSLSSDELEVADVQPPAPHDQADAG
jgi:hypothetical protein